MKTRMKGGAQHQAARTGKYRIMCKCPADGCGRMHVELWDVRPIVTPRRFCPHHVYLRYDAAAGSGYMLEKRTGHRKARS